jgi:hypothetical protein
MPVGHLGRDRGHLLAGPLRSYVTRPASEIISPTGA